MEKCKIGRMECWKIGIRKNQQLEDWKAGILELWNIGRMLGNFLFFNIIVKYWKEL
ncbi:MAG: hypothetical protein PHE00_07270 [Atribacterota bacterium]|jgi:hypothetical protein|nr:hypothetical protein [Atribacterota bacterium]MDD3641566.1 hypothetical protein [Atribacterota bacterium]